jgi:hypothetical protein
MQDWFVINDLDEFTDKARNIVYNNFGLSDDEDKSEIDSIIDTIEDNDKKELDKVLSHNESLAIIKASIKKEKNRRTKKIRYILNDIIFADIIYSLNDRMVSNIIGSLVKKGLVESAFDNEKNDFIFWVKEDDEIKKQTEDTETD